MKIKLLHIGLAKAGSTFLQNEIFPEIENKLNIKNLNFSNYVDKKKIIKHPLENLSKLEEKLPENFILSYERLFSYSWEFNNIHESFELIKNNFSKNTMILIILRNPYDFLNSIYTQSLIHHNSKIISPRDFFYNEKNKEIRLNDKYNLFNFDYEKLINLYKNYFNKVIIAKYEDIHSLSFLSQLISIDDKFLNQLRLKKNIYYNKSVSEFSVKTILFLNKYINLTKYDQFLKKNIKPSNKLLSKLKNNILNQLTLRVFFQSKVDHILKYKKYNIDKKNLPIDIDLLIEKYNNI